VEGADSNGGGELQWREMNFEGGRWRFKSFGGKILDKK
jgi:hypothetical protein